MRGWTGWSRDRAYQIKHGPGFIKPKPVKPKPPAKKKPKGGK